MVIGLRCFSRENSFYIYQPKHKLTEYTPQVLEHLLLGSGAVASDDLDVDAVLGATHVPGQL